jgi:hypothetical protein
MNNFEYELVACMCDLKELSDNIEKLKFKLERTINNVKSTRIACKEMAKEIGELCGINSAISERFDARKAS